MITVKRKAKVGERVYITRSTETNYDVGDWFFVDDVDENGTVSGEFHEQTLTIELRNYEVIENAD